MAGLKPLSVTQLGNYIKKIFEAEELLYNISVYGEVSGFKVAGSNAYFNLKDEGGLVSCIFFDFFGTPPKNGDKMLVTGTPRFYVKGGALSFYVLRMQPYGIGEMYRKFLELKQSLEKEGLFREEYKKELPDTIKKIGVVTSDGGAVIHDIINVASRRDPSVSIVLFPAKVQGFEAKTDIINGIRYFDSSSVDVIILARGGGSFEDLNCFNEEEVVRAIFACEKPVISAVGHETDFTLSDFVADTRAPTPSAAAEIVTGLKQARIETIRSSLVKLSSLYSSMTELRNKRVETNRERLFASFMSLVKEKEFALKNSISTFVVKTSTYLEEKFFQVALQQKSVENQNPVFILKKGYCRLEMDNKPVKSLTGIPSNSKAGKLFFYDGDIEINLKTENKK